MNIEIASFIISVLALLITCIDSFKEWIVLKWLCLFSKHDVLFFPIDNLSGISLNDFWKNIEKAKLSDWFENGIYGVRYRSERIYGAKLTKRGCLAFQNVDCPFLKISGAEIYDCCKFFIPTRRGKRKIQRAKWDIGGQ